MTKDQFSSLLDHIQSAERQVCKDGQYEYAHDDNNVFANFDDAAESIGGTRIDDLMHHALKHWRGICAWVEGHRSQREDIRGRIKDLRMYLALLWGMIDEEQEAKDSQIMYSMTYDLLKQYKDKQKQKHIIVSITEELDYLLPQGSMTGNATTVKVICSCGYYENMDYARWCTTRTTLGNLRNDIGTEWVHSGVGEPQRPDCPPNKQICTTGVEEQKEEDDDDDPAIVKLRPADTKVLCSCLKHGDLDNDDTMPYEKTTAPFGKSVNILANGKCDKCYGKGLVQQQNAPEHTLSKHLITAINDWPDRAEVICACGYTRIYKKPSTKIVELRAIRDNNTEYSHPDDYSKPYSKLWNTRQHDPGKGKYTDPSRNHE